MTESNTADDRLKYLQGLTQEELRRYLQEKLRTHEELVEWAKERGFMDDEGDLVFEIQRDDD